MPLTRTAAVLRVLAAGLCAFPLLQACGRSEPGDYLFDYGSPSGTGNSGSGASSSTGARPATAATGANGTGANGSGADGTGADGNGANGSGANGNGGTGIGAGGEGVIVEGGAADPGTGGTGSGGSASQGGSGTAGAPGGPRINCGDTSCDASKQVCCAGLGGFGCIAKNKSCNGTVLRCSDTDDCPGNAVCCLRIIDDANTGSQCKASCVGMGPSRERQLCSSDDECFTNHCRATVFGVSVCTRR